MEAGIRCALSAKQQGAVRLPEQIDLGWYRNAGDEEWKLDGRQPRPRPMRGRAMADDGAPCAARRAQSARV
jgi:hypothetical protein